MNLYTNLTTIFRNISAPWMQRSEVLERALHNQETAVPYAVTATALTDDNGNFFASRKTKVITGTSYTITNDDCGCPLEFTNGGAITVTVSRKLNPEFSCFVTPEGAGTITFQKETGALDIHSEGDKFSSSGQRGAITVRCRANSDGNSASIRLYGSLA